MSYVRQNRLDISHSLFLVYFALLQLRETTPIMRSATIFCVLLVDVFADSGKYCFNDFQNSNFSAFDFLNYMEIETDAAHSPTTMNPCERISFVSFSFGFFLRNNL